MLLLPYSPPHLNIIYVQHCIFYQIKYVELMTSDVIILNYSILMSLKKLEYKEYMTHI